MTVRIVQVIYTDERTAGKGTAGDIMRRIPALYTLTGELICEFDIGASEDRSYLQQLVSSKSLAILRDQT